MIQAAMAGDNNAVVPEEVKEEVKASFFDKLNAWGSSSLPPSLMATLTAALHSRPLQPFPLLLFTPPLLFSSYLNLSGFTTASAGLTAAWSGLYALLALRRRQVGGLKSKFSPRGMVRGAAIGLGASNAVAGGWTYMRGDFKRDDELRAERRRWER